MEYYAGLFDAEGCISLTPSGSIKIRLNNTKKCIPEMFKEKFGGIVYTESSRPKKPIFSWYLNSENIISFCREIIPLSIVKKPQLELILAYKDSTREYRREFRKEYVHKIAECKKPPTVTRDYFCNIASIDPDIPFYKWLAGFIEGDGSIRLYEQSFEETRFTTCIGASNVFPEPIQYISQRVFGNLTCTKSTPHIMWKWLCSEKVAKKTLIELMPFLYVMKEQAHLILNFLEIKESKKWHDRYTFDQINTIRDIIIKVKHLNSQ